MEQQIDTHRDGEQSSRLIRVVTGEHGRKVMPHSEVCMHMRVAGREMAFALLDGGSVQLLNDDGSHFSIPITNGEAGVYEDRDGYYFHSPFKDARTN